MVRDGVLDDLDELDAGLRGCDVVLVEQLDHQAGEPLEGPRDPSGRVDLDQHVVGSSDEHLQECGEVLCHQNAEKLSLHLEKSGPVERRVEQHKEALGRGESGEWGRKLGKMAS